MTKERSGIVAAGNWIVDHVKLIDVYPVQDSLANIREESANNGGSPYNVLKDLTKMVCILQKCLLISYLKRSTLL